MTENTALDILKAARAKIADPRDWGKGRRYINRPMETFCAAEAIETSGPWHVDSSLEYKRAFRALYHAAGLNFGSGKLVDWNDAPERTYAEVIAAFNLAIATLRLS